MSAPQVLGIVSNRFTSSYDNPASTSFFTLGRKTSWKKSPNFWATCLLNDSAMIADFFFVSAAYFWDWNSSCCSFRTPRRAWAHIMATTIARFLASSSSRPCKKRLGVRVRGEDVKIADGHVVRRILSLVACVY